MNVSTDQSQRPERLGVRLPPGMTERIKDAAAEDSRTMTSWVEKVIKDALEASEKARRH